jgi:hypothetical protein
MGACHHRNMWIESFWLAWTNIRSFSMVFTCFYHQIDPISVLSFRRPTWAQKIRKGGVEFWLATNSPQHFVARVLEVSDLHPFWCWDLEDATRIARFVLDSPKNPDPDPILFAMEIHGTCWTFSRNIPGEGFRAGWWLSGGVSISAPRRILEPGNITRSHSETWVPRFLASIKVGTEDFGTLTTNHRNITVCWLDMDMEALHFLGGLEWAGHPILWSSLVTCFTHLKQFSRCKM